MDGFATDTLDILLENLSHADSVAAISHVIGDELERLGFERWAYMIVRPPQGPRAPLVLTNYPDEWAYRYTEQDYLRADPVVPAAASRAVPFLWQPLVDERSASAKQRQMFNEAAESGLRSGATIPVRGPDPCFATFSVAGTDQGPNFGQLWRERRHFVHVAAAYAHEAIVHRAYSEQREKLYRLSPRESEVLLWTARGKTAWEVSEITGISRDTVNEYLQSACRKLGVFSKIHAVVKAVMLGMVVP